MTNAADERGVTTVLLERMRKVRLPRALALKEKVDRGERLDDADLQFLEDVMQDADRSRSVVVRNPELHELAGRMVSLYAEITAKALENEKKA
ncbi:MAG TPA: hypothetical protein VLW45_08225 [Pelomicrobium sp.]|nr:hypothetical protein [Pelomicrobium sp.]